MVKPSDWVVDMRHYIDKGTGDLPEVIPERVLTLATFFGAIVAWVTDHLPDGGEHTPMCPVDAVLDGVAVAATLSRSSTACLDTSSASGPLCGDHAMIHGWEGTLWNRHGGARPLPTARP